MAVKKIFESSLLVIYAGNTADTKPTPASGDTREHWYKDRETGKEYAYTGSGWSNAWA